MRVHNPTDVAFFVNALNRKIWQNQTLDCTDEQAEALRNSPVLVILEDEEPVKAPEPKAPAPETVRRGNKKIELRDV